MTIKAMARQGPATARRREQQTGGVVREAWGREAPGPGKTWPTGRCHGRPRDQGSSETAGRNRCPRYRVTKESSLHVEALDVEPQPRRRSGSVQREQGGLAR